MRFQVTSACLHSGGQHAGEGEIIDVPPNEAAALQQAGRGHPAPPEVPAPAPASAPPPVIPENDDPGSGPDDPENPAAPPAKPAAKPKK